MSLHPYPPKSIPFKKPSLLLQMYVLIIDPELEGKVSFKAN